MLYIVLVWRLKQLYSSVLTDPRLQRGFCGIRIYNACIFCYLSVKSRTIFQHPDLTTFKKLSNLCIAQ
jgi:hypothetical protein